MSAALAKKLETKSNGLRPVAQYLPFVRKVAQRLARRLPTHVSLEDLISAGVVGLLEAMERYDSSRVTDFETYAEFRVKGSILDELRRRDMMARDARLEAKKIEKVITKLTNELGREPEEEEVSACLGLSVEELRQKLERLTPVRVVSFNDLYPGTAIAANDDPFLCAERTELSERLSKAIRKLSERQQQVLQLYYKEELTLREIGEVLSVTESRVCQIVSEATLRLRVLLGAGSAKPKKKRRSARRAG